MPGRNPELSNIRRLAEAALLVAVFTAMAFQYLRNEVFETEKNAILGIVAAIIIGANLVEYIGKRGLPRVQNPLLLSVFVMIFAGLASTVFSLDPSYSFWGSPTRAHGLVMLVIYLALVWQGMRSGKRLQEALLPVIVMTSIPMCLWAIQSYASQDSSVFRPASFAGNPNYLAGWVAMFVFYFTAEVWWKLCNWDRPYSLLKWGQLTFYAAVLLLNLATFVILSSRGAFAGFAAGFLAAVIIYLAYYRQRILLGVTVVAVIAGLIGYIVITEQYRGDNPDQIGFARIFVPYDQSRDVLWRTAVKIIEQSTEPFSDANGNEDNWAFLRPAVGYGLETLEQTQSRFGEPFASSEWSNRFVERFHNLFFDWIVEAGTLGVLAIISIYESAIYLAMRKLKFITTDQTWYWLGLQIVAVPAGVWYTSTVIPQYDFTAIIPLGGAVGSVLGTLAWIAWSGFQQSTPADGEETAKRETTHGDLIAIAVLCITFAQLIDNQFGFMQIMSQTLFFVMLGFLIAVSDSPETSEVLPEEEEPVSIRESRYWLASTVVTGMFLIYSFGTAISSNFMDAAIGGTELLPFLVIVFVAGLIIALLTHFDEESSVQEEVTEQPISKRDKKSRRKKNASQPQAQDQLGALNIFWMLGLVVIFWGIFYLIRNGLVDSAGTMLDNALTNRTGPSASMIRQTFYTLGLNGILLMVFAVGLFFWVNRAKEGFHLFGISTVGIAVFAIVGAFFYISNFSVATMRSTADGFTRDVPILQALIAADVIYDTALDSRPNDVKLRLSQVDSLVTQTGLVADPNQMQVLEQRIVQKSQEALDTAPFFVNSLTWQILNQKISFFSQATSSGNNAVPPAANFPGDAPPGINSPFDPNNANSGLPGGDISNLPPPLQTQLAPTMQAQQNPPSGVEQQPPSGS